MVSPSSTTPITSSLSMLRLSFLLFFLLLSSHLITCATTTTTTTTTTKNNNNNSPSHNLSSFHWPLINHDSLNNRQTSHAFPENKPIALPEISSSSPFSLYHHGCVKSITSVSTTTPPKSIVIDEWNHLYTFQLIDSQSVFIISLFEDGSVRWFKRLTLPSAWVNHIDDEKEIVSMETCQLSLIRAYDEAGQAKSALLTFSTVDSILFLSTSDGQVVQTLKLDYPSFASECRNKTGHSMVSEVIQTTITMMPNMMVSSEDILMKNKKRMGNGGDQSEKEEEEIEDDDDDDDATTKIQTALTIECSTKLALLQPFSKTNSFRFRWQRFETDASFYYSPHLALTSKFLYAMAYYYHESTTSSTDQLLSYLIAVDISHSGADPEVIAWRFDANIHNETVQMDELFSNPVVTNDEKQVYVGLLKSGQIVSLDAQSGDVLWITSISDHLKKCDPLSSGAILHRDLALFTNATETSTDLFIYVSSVCGDVVAIDGYSGNVRWAQIQTQQSSSQLSDSSSLIVSKQGNLILPYFTTKQGISEWVVTNMDATTGNTVWTKSIKTLDSLKKNSRAFLSDNIGPISVSSHGTLYYQISSRGNSIQRLGQVMIKTLSPSSIYFAEIDNSDRPVNITVTFEQPNSTLLNVYNDGHSVSCFVIVPLLSPIDEVQFPGYIVDGIAHCLISNLTSYFKFVTPFKSAATIVVMVQVGQYRTNSLPVLVYNSPRLDSAMPKYAPVRSAQPIWVYGQFNASLKDQTIICSYTDQTSLAEYLVNGRIIDEGRALCPIACDYPQRTRYSLKVCVPVPNQSAPKGSKLTPCSYFFRVSNYTLLIYDPPVFDSANGTLSPVSQSSTRTLVMTGRGFEPEVMNDKSTKMSCLFETCVSTGPIRTEAACSSFNSKQIQTKEQQVKCICDYPTYCTLNSHDVYKKIPILFSESYLNLGVGDIGGVFNTTNQDVIIYREPRVSSMEPKSSNYSGGHLCTVHGSEFFPSPSLACRFGNEIVPAKYINPKLITCVIPPLHGDIYLPFPFRDVITVSLTVSENGKDFAFPGLSFQYFVETDCPLNCAPHGFCNRILGICSCYKGWTGDTCNISEQYSRTSRIIWIVAVCVTLLSVAVFALVMLISGMHYRHQGKQYQRLVQERMHNDISTAL